MYLSINSVQKYDLKIFLYYVEKSSTAEEINKVFYTISGFLSVHPTLLHNVRKIKVYGKHICILIKYQLKKENFIKTL